MRDTRIELGRGLACIFQAGSDALLQAYAELQKILLPPACPEIAEFNVKEAMFHVILMCEVLGRDSSCLWAYWNDYTLFVSGGLRGLQFFHRQTTNNTALDCARALRVELMVNVTCNPPISTVCSGHYAYRKKSATRSTTAP